MSEYKVVLRREDDGGYSVTVPDLPGCASQGETKREASRNVREAGPSPQSSQARA